MLELTARFPDAVGEAMEGGGVGLAASLFDVPFVEVRGISNIVGVRDPVSFGTNPPRQSPSEQWSSPSPPLLAKTNFGRPTTSERLAHNAGTRPRHLPRSMPS